MNEKINNETSRLQIRIPIEIKDQLDKVVKQNVMGRTNSKSLMVSMALMVLFKDMSIKSIDDIYLKEYIPSLQELNDGFEFLGDD